MRKNKGFTLMELTIVMTILVIIAAILVPVFFLTTSRARLRGDIQSARVIQNAIDLYRIERRQPVPGSPNVDTILANLAAAGYINPRNLTIQTERANWIIDAEFGVKVDISGNAVPDEVHRAFAGLSEEEQAYVHGGDPNR